MSAMFLHCKVTDVLFQLIAFWGYPLSLCNYPLSHITLSPTDFSTHQWFLYEIVTMGIAHW